jgi:alanine-glyoxylate transaminase/serine-glyoxylate transaminase/serine-pyruvate transaminase
MVPDAVSQALAAPTLGHLDPRFLALADAMAGELRALMKTQNAMTLALSGTGSAGMEAAFANFVEPGDEILVLINGAFGGRMREVAGRLGAKVDSLEFEWGKPVDAAQAIAKAKQKPYTLVAMVHAETSTGVANPVAEIGAALKGGDALFVVDAVTSLGGMPFEMDAWGIDICYSGTQKCLACPPGLSPASFSEKAMAKLKARKSKVPNWYLDLTLLGNYWGQGRVYHHTAPINMIYGLYRAAGLVLEEGLEASFQRHREAHGALVSGLAKLGLGMLVDEPYRLPMLNAVLCPTGVDEAALRKQLLLEDGIEIGGGLGPLAGKIWRVGLMGHTARLENVERLLTCLGKRLGQKSADA